MYILITADKLEKILEGVEAEGEERPDEVRLVSPPMEERRFKCIPVSMPPFSEEEQLLRERGWEKVCAESGMFLGWCLPKKPPFMVVTTEYALNWQRNQLKKQ